MYFCSPCAAAERWPESHFKSYGRCEVCGRQAECSDIPSRFLPQTVFVITGPEEVEEDEPATQDRVGGPA